MAPHARASAASPCRRACRAVLPCEMKVARSWNDV
jgi:hypothetical protein